MFVFVIWFEGGIVCLMSNNFVDNVGVTTP